MNWDEFKHFQYTYSSNLNIIHVSHCYFSGLCAFKMSFIRLKCLILMLFCFAPFSHSFLQIIFFYHLQHFGYLFSFFFYLHLFKYSKKRIFNCEIEMALHSTYKQMLLFETFGYEKSFKLSKTYVTLT